MKKIKNELIVTLTRFLGIFFKNKDINICHPKILIISTTGLGDTIWATPSFSYIKSRFPEATIDVLTSPIGAVILQNNPNLSNTYSLKNGAINTLLYQLLKLRSNHYEIIFLFHTSQRLIPSLGYLLNKKHFYGIPQNAKSYNLFTNKNHLNCAYNSLHQADVRLFLLKEYLPKHSVLTKKFSAELTITLTKNNLTEINIFLNKKNINNKLLFIQPGSNQTHQQWNPEKFIETANVLISKYKLQVIVSGSPKEKILVKNIAANIPDAICIYGQLNLKEIATLIFKSSIMLTNDTGPMHIASAFKIPIFAIILNANITGCRPYNNGFVKLFSCDNTEGYIQKISPLTVSESICQYISANPNLKIEQISEQMND